MKYTAEKKVEIKKESLNLTFGAYRRVWNEATDDRKVFCNTYDMMMDALDAMKGIDNTVIWCGFNDQYEKNMKMMDRIVKGFMA